MAGEPGRIEDGLAGGEKMTKTRSACHHPGPRRFKGHSAEEYPPICRVPADRLQHRGRAAGRDR